MNSYQKKLTSLKRPATLVYRKWVSFMDLLKARRLLDTGKSIFDIELRVVYYARVSTDRDEQLNSLENQTGYYENLIKTNKNWTFSGGYIDEGISGTSVNKREEFLRMIDDGMEEKFDLIITKEISRFSRSTLDSIKYTQDLLSHGVGVFFQSDNINTLYSDSELRLTIMASLAQDEMRRLSERVKFGMRQAYENGKVLGTNNLYGYKKQDCKLIVDEETAPFIRDLFSLYASGKYGFRTITRKLTEMGYRNQQGKELNPGTLKQILINPKYKGYYHGRLTESNNYRDKKSIKLPESDHLLYKDEDIPAIVSEELWERANSILKEREIKYKKKSSGTQSRFPYSGKIKCEEHGTFYYRKMWKDRKVPQEGWCCKVYLAKGRKECKSPHLYTRDLDAILAKIGEDILENKEKYQSDIDELLSMYAQTTPTRVDFAADIKKLSSDMAKIGAKKDKILELYTDDDISKEEYLETKNKLNSELEKISQKIETLKKEQADSNEQTALLQTVQKELNDIQKSKQSALEVAQNMLKEITVLRESTEKCVKIRIDMKFPKTEQVSIIKPFILYSDTEDTIIAKINTVGDVDCFKFTPTKSFTSTLNITGQADFKVYDSFLSFDELVSENGKYSFEANKSYYIKVSGTTENATPVYTFQLDKPSSSLGAEYEQTKSNLTNLTAPKITDVGVNVLNFVKGKYRITLDIDDCIYDSRAENTFFYWESSDGTISGADVNADGSISFVYQANKGTGVRTVRLIIGFGDGLGQVDRKVILLKGNEEE